ncbi:ABC transporter permease subunit [Paenibacillus dendritiformis]|uniref:ABC transporter permease subunit n=1 Tax=Paenibacillus dendritiformis TaxID=130049 RepID=UPI001BCBF7D5|nr:ABC transporter permease subunit [Paenibacillus dendritiformis]
MSFRAQFLRTLIISIFAMLMVILIVLFPRDLDIHYDEYKVNVNYGFSWVKYGNNIKVFFAALFDEGSLGNDRYNLPIVTVVLVSVAKSLAVIVTALVLSFGLGVLKGIMDYKLSRTKWNFFGNWTTWLFQSLPDFLVLLLIQWYVIRYLPFIRFFSTEEWYSFLLPAVLVSIYPTMYIARITSASIAEQESKMYITVARAKGLTQRLIFYKHVFYNSFGTILTHLSSLFVYVLSNLLMVEYFMNFPGAAYRLFLAIDYSVNFGTGPNYEPGVIIGIAFCFMIMVLIVQWISLAARRHFEAR